MSDKAKTVKIVGRCAAAAGVAAVALIAPATAAADTHTVPCPDSSYCIAPGPDPDLSYGTHPYIPFGPDPSMRGDQAF